MESKTQFHCVESKTQFCLIACVLVDWDTCRLRYDLFVVLHVSCFEALTGVMVGCACKLSRLIRVTRDKMSCVRNRSGAHLACAIQCQFAPLGLFPISRICVFYALKLPPSKGRLLRNSNHMADDNADLNCFLTLNFPPLQRAVIVQFQSHGG